MKIPNEKKLVGGYCSKACCEYDMVGPRFRKAKAVATHLSRIGARGGKSKSAAKTKAARKNGKLGGRPRTVSNPPQHPA